MIRAFFDGLCQPVNPGGIACFAYLIKRDGKVIQTDYGLAAEPFSQDATNNVAEFTALVKALEWLSANALDEPIRIVSDSELVVRQMKGEYKVKAGRILPLHRRAMALMDSFPDVEINWVPREENKEADSLTNKAYREALRDRAHAKRKGQARAVR